MNIRMKKRVGLFLLLLTIFTLSGCRGTSGEEGGLGVNLYYVSNTETKVEMHPYRIQEKELENQIVEVIEQLSTLPDKLKYKPPLAMGFSILDFEVEDGRIQLDMDEGYKELKATTEVLVRAALVRSFTQIQGIQYVSITVQGEQLHDRLGKVVGLMSAEQFIDNAGNEINSYERVRLKLYFANEEGTALVATNRTLAYSTNVPLEKLVVEQILSGPDIREVYPTVSPGTKLIGITVKDTVCYVNLDEQFLTKVANVSAEVAIYSIVNSLTELKSVNKVQISLNGESNLTYREVYNLTTIFERNLDLVEQPES